MLQFSFLPVAGHYSVTLHGLQLTEDNCYCEIAEYMPVDQTISLLKMKIVLEMHA